MREDTKKRLDQALLRERLKKIGIALAIAAVLALVVIYQNYDLQVTNSQVPGTVTEIDPLVSKRNSADGESVRVKLDNGSTVSILALKSRHLQVGDKIEVVEHHHATGRVTYTYK